MEYVMAGQTGDDGTEQAAELWYLAEETYGKQTTAGYSKVPHGGAGDGGGLLQRTQPVAPAGPTGKATVRRVYVVLGWQFGGARVRITPILDFSIRLPSTTVSLAAPADAKAHRDEVEVKLARVCTWVEVETEVLERSGRVDVMGVYLAGRGFTEAASSVAGVNE